MKKKLLVLFSLLLCFTFLLVQASAAFEREVRVFVATTGKTLLSSHLHSILLERLSRSALTFVAISRDSSNRVTSIQMHSTLLSQFAEELTILLQEALVSYPSKEFGVPLGNITSIVFLSGKGPVIPVKPVILGSAASDIKSEFTSAGINQTLHRVSLTFSVAVRYLSPLNDTFDSITIHLPIAETLIVGNVPIYKD